VSQSLDESADKLILRIKRFLITYTGKMLHEASSQEFYYALCMVLRERIMINWTANWHSFAEHKAKRLYYISMEYLPGRFLGNNLTNIGARDLVGVILNKTNRIYKEIADVEPDPGLGNGGLGRLASCFLDSLATQKYPAMGFGLRYQYGIFDQEIWNGQQVERPDCWLLDDNPWLVRKDLQAVSVSYRGTPISATNSHGDEIFQLQDYEEVRALPYDVPIIGYSKDGDFSTISMRLWTTKESPRNFELQRYNAGQLDQAGENTSLTDVLYPNDNNETGKRIRLKQEFLLVSASLQDMIKRHLSIYGDLSSFADKNQIQINDTHPALVIAELTRMLNTHFDFKWKDAWNVVGKVCNFTNHTILKESLEEWNVERMSYLLPRQFKVIEKLNQEFCSEIRKRFQGDEQKVKRMTIIEKGQVKMAHLAIYGCKKVNGVAALHSEILKNRIFKDFFEMYPDKFVNVTNGVTQRRWLLSANPSLSAFITKHIGNNWYCDFSEIKKLKEIASDKQAQEDFLAIKQENKEKLLDFLTKENPIRDACGKIIGHSEVLGVDALFDMQIKRFHEYKRQLMNALHLIMLYFEIKKDPNARKAKRLALIAGKAAPGYIRAKQIITLFYCIINKLNADENVNKFLRVAFIENYNVSKAEIIIPAADLSEQISTAGTEASGTGNMKLSMNGAMTIGTDDGANIEMKEAIGEQWFPFIFGAKSDEIEKSRNENSYDPKEVYLNNPQIKEALDALKDGSFANNEAEHLALSTIYESLLEKQDGRHPDYYFVLRDLMPYYEAQKKVEEMYADPHKWAEFAIQNIAGMARFSSDEVINNYVNSIWEIEKCHMNKDILNNILKEYNGTTFPCPPQEK
jgi:glycogen phosphorylase